jgi:8-oxo-dGTP diphosphatase
MMDWVPPRRVPDDSVMFLYAAGPLVSSQIQFPPDELRSWKWCDRDMMAEHLSDFMFRRLEGALSAITNGTVAELQEAIPQCRLIELSYC